MDGQYKRTISSINNAWRKSTYLDDYGQVWLDTINLHCILRTSKGNTRYILAAIPDKYKVVNVKKTYIRGYEVVRLIDKTIEECGLGTKDELTGELLNHTKSDFSHIRSCSVYPYFAYNINNGIVVNKETHKIITNRNINDEEELFELCKELGWKINWYEKCKKYFNKINYKK